MTWNLEWSQNAVATLSQLEKSEASRIVKKLESILSDPARFFERLAGFDEYKLRIGDYRVIVLLLHSSNTIFIERLGHRKNIYKCKAPKCLKT